MSAAATGSRPAVGSSQKIQSGCVQGGPDQRDLLRHSTRVGREHRVGAIGQLETLEQLRDPLAALGLWNAVEVAEVIQVLGSRVSPVQSRLVGHDPKPRAHLVQLLGQAQAVELDQARVGPQDSAEAAQRGRLARAVLTEQHEQLAASRHAGRRRRRRARRRSSCEGPRPGSRSDTSNSGDAAELQDDEPRFFRTSRRAPRILSLRRPAPRLGRRQGNRRDRLLGVPGCQVAAALAAVLADDLNRVRHLRIFDSHQQRHVALLQESTG